MIIRSSLEVIEDGSTLLPPLTRVEIGYAALEIIEHISALGRAATLEHSRAMVEGGLLALRDILVRLDRLEEQGQLFGVGGAGTL